MKKILFILIISLNLSNAQVKVYSVDIPNPTSFYCKQQQSNWCWAACNEMLLKAIDIDETQESQVMKVFKKLVNLGAGDNFELAKKALSGTYIDNNGDTQIITAYTSYLGQNADDPLVIINHLNDGIPIIMATQRHGRVCVGVDYTITGNFYQIITLRLLNPLKSNRIETYSMDTLLKMENGLIGFMTID